jgi:hypothetical protein
MKGAKFVPRPLLLSIEALTRQILPVRSAMLPIVQQPNVMWLYEGHRAARCALPDPVSNGDGPVGVDGGIASGKRDRLNTVQRDAQTCVQSFCPG